MIRSLLSLDRLSFLEPEGKVGYRHGEKGAKQETMDYLITRWEILPLSFLGRNVAENEKVNYYSLDSS